jgi:hypothetical protein
MEFLAAETVRNLITLSDGIKRSQESWKELTDRVAKAQELKDVLGYSQEEQELVDFISSLSDDEKAELLALVWIGRGDGKWPESWEYLVNHARSTVSNAGPYLVEKVSLSEYLREGLSQITKEPKNDGI